MSIGYLNFCLDGVPGVGDGHIHAQEVRTFNEISDWTDVTEILQSKYLRAAVAAGPGGGLTIHRQDDGKYAAQFHIDQECAGDPAVFDDVYSAFSWVEQNLPRCFVTPAVASTAVN